MSSKHCVNMTPVSPQLLSRLWARGLLSGLCAPLLVRAPLFLTLQLTGPGLSSLIFALTCLAISPHREASPLVCVFAEFHLLSSLETTFFLLILSVLITLL